MSPAFTEISNRIQINRDITPLEITSISNRYLKKSLIWAALYSNPHKIYLFLMPHTTKIVF